MFFIPEIFKEIYNLFKSMLFSLSEESRLRKKFWNFSDFSAYFYLCQFDVICNIPKYSVKSVREIKRKQRTKEILLKISLSVINMLQEDAFENCMYVAETSYKKETVKEAISKAESCARNEEDFARIKRRIVGFFDLDSKEVEGLMMTTREFDDLLVRKHLSK